MPYLGLMLPVAGHATLTWVWLLEHQTARIDEENNESDGMDEINQ